MTQYNSFRDSRLFLKQETMSGLVKDILNNAFAGFQGGGERASA